jgi:hypothetical protein
VKDGEKPIEVVLSHLVGRSLSATELFDAFGMKRATFYAHRNAGRLLTADNLMRAAKSLGLNPVDLLIRYELLTPASVIEYADDLMRRRRENHELIDRV